MGWNPDRPPLEYLQRRLKYYKKRAGQIKTLLKEEPSEYLKKYYGGKKGYIKSLSSALDKNIARQKEYIEAINKLK